MTKYKVVNEESGKILKYVDTENMIYLSCDGVLNRNGCTDNATLFMTKRSKRFFVLYRSMWQGSVDHVVEVSTDEACEFVMDNESVEDANEIIEKYFPGCERFTELE